MASEEQQSQLIKLFAQANEVYHFDSALPPSCLEEDCLLGIDEAGRGPVLGPMVYAAAFYPLKGKKELDVEKKFQDSKTLTEAERSSMFERMNEFGIGYVTTILSPIVISNAMLRRSKYNLNWLSHDTAIELIRKALEAGVQLREVYVDTVGPADKYEAKLKSLFPSLKIKVANKADSLYKIVSVASICAKYVRDYLVQHWQFIEGLHYQDYGSGYPGDPKTKEFLKQSFDPLFGFPTFVRFSWSTVTKILESDAIEVKWEDDNSDEENDFNPKKKIKTKQITNFFKYEKDREKPKVEDEDLHTSFFFVERGLTQVTSMEDFFSH